MKQFKIILAINLLFLTVLIMIPGSSLYHFQDIFLFNDSHSYLDPPAMDMRRTMGYPWLLNFFQLFDNWYFPVVIMNCFLAAWMFQVTYWMAGKWTWLLAALGAYTVYVPHILTDLIFATFFITSIWRLKEKGLVGHFILLGLASLIRPSLAWFFLVEPFVLYFYGYRGKAVYWSAILAFIVTSFNPIRNFVNHGVWTHSTVLSINMTSEKYFGGKDSVIGYFWSAFKGNWMADHFKYLGNIFGLFKVDTADGRTASKLMLYLYWIGVSAMMFIWTRFGIRFLQKKINLGDALILAYFIIPTLFGNTGARLRLPVEWILIL